MDVLIVEDSKNQQFLLESFIKKLGHNAFVADNGVEAIEVLNQHSSIRIVISDWNMPEMDGVALCRHLRKEQKKYCYFILVTGNTDDQSVVDGLNVGADDYIKKPVKFDELEARIKSGIRIIELETMLEDKNNQLSLALDTIEKDMQSAASMQKSLLAKPQRIHKTEFDWYFKPSKILGGDMFGYHTLDDNHICFYQLDVAGHGISSALFSFALNRLMSDMDERTSILKHEIDQAPYYKIVPVSDVIAKLNEKFQTTADTMLYFTMVYGILNVDSGIVHLQHAGHPPVVWIKPKTASAELLSGTGLPVGMLENPDYKSETIQLEAGDKLVLYSDGIIECENAEEECFGFERWRKLLSETANLSLKASVNHYRKVIQKWHGSEHFDDDVTYLLLEWGK